MCYNFKIATMLLLENKQIAIVGAGPVGLTMARLLQNGGLQVNVYERDLDADARIWGGTLDLHLDSGQKALAAAGLLEHYYQLARPMGVKFAGFQGDIIATKSISPEHYKDNPEINRNILRTMLLESLQPGTVRWNHKVIAADEYQGQWRLAFSNGHTTEADLIIIAGGGSSKIRSLVTDEAVLETGSFIIQGDICSPATNLPSFYQLCDGHRLMVAKDGQLLVVNPLNNKSLTYGFIFQPPASWQAGKGLDFANTKAVSDFIINSLEGWSEIFHNLIRKTFNFVGLPTRVLPLEKPWKINRPLPVTLIGDTAHLMPPFAGMGVNTGLMDAMILSENLLNPEYRSLEAAISDYEEKMLQYAREAIRESRENELEMRNPEFDFRDLLF